MLLSEFVTALRNTGRKSDRAKGGLSDKAAQYLREIRKASAENDERPNQRPLNAEEWRKSIGRNAYNEITRRGGKPLKTGGFVRALERVSGWACERPKPWLVLTGTIGTGKSTLAKAAALSIAEAAGCMGYATMRATATNWMKPEEMENVARAAILLIDDLGCEQADVRLYGNTVSPMAEIVCERYDNMLTTIFTTNELASDLKEIYGDRIADRMREMCTVIKMDGDSFREGGGDGE